MRKKENIKSKNIRSENMSRCAGGSVVLLLLLVVSATNIHALGVSPARVTVEQEAGFTKNVNGLIFNNERLNRTVQIDVDDPFGILVGVPRTFVFTSDEEQKQFNYKLQLPTSNIPTGTVARIRVHDIPASTGQAQASITLEVPITINTAPINVTTMNISSTNTAESANKTTINESNDNKDSTQSQKRAKQIVITKKQQTKNQPQEPINAHTDADKETANAPEKTSEKIGNKTFAVLLLLVWIIIFVCLIRYWKDR